ncbi:MAG: protein-L-isoaspartate(D-aspartate) O-methyltransferase [Candidatus Lernaella stagnicola]|nr:protein-L-isoaspartate(D-aspartate) O-methyltransferase [Candidatus Lernaella stagnicola]
MVRHTPTPEQLETARDMMVEKQLKARGIKDPRVLDVMARLPRERFMPQHVWAEAYADRAVPIGQGQTISQPLIVALMTEALELKGKEKVLEVGTGSGYQAAILAHLADRVFTIERVRELGRQAERLFAEMRLDNILVRIADGSHGWREEVPFDAIIVTAGAPVDVDHYLEQLPYGGRLVVPVGSTPNAQTLLRFTRERNRTVKEDYGPCRFVPLVGHYGWNNK